MGIVSVDRKDRQSGTQGRAQNSKLKQGAGQGCAGALVGQVSCIRGRTGEPTKRVTREARFRGAWKWMRSVDEVNEGGLLERTSKVQRQAWKIVEQVPRTRQRQIDGRSRWQNGTDSDADSSHAAGQLPTLGAGPARSWSLAACSAGPYDDMSRGADFGSSAAPALPKRTQEIEKGSERCAEPATAAPTWEHSLHSTAAAHGNSCDSVRRAWN